MNKFIISNFLLYTTFLILIFIYPLCTKSFDGTYIQQIKFFYSSINYLKAPFILIISIFAKFIIDQIDNIYIFSLLNLVLILLLILFLPSHCPFNFCFYQPGLSYDFNYINFFGIGDIQNMHFTKNNTNWKWQNRIKATDFYIKAINQFTQDAEFIEIESEYKDVFKEAMKDHFLGVISVGDCTQSGNNIGRLSKNDIGAYEYAFNNNPEDKGMLKIPSFEVLGNHDYYENNDYFDFIKNLFLFEGNPMTNMQLRRNQKRKFIKRSDKYGNYSLDIKDLHIIFINVWPSKEWLLNGNPIGSLEFLEEDLKHNNNKNWILVTHYMPRVKNSFDEIIDINGKKKKYLSDFGFIYKKYPNCLGVLYGHIHVRKLYTFNNNGLQHYILPGPASFLDKNNLDIKEIQIPLFIYKKSKLYVFRIMASKDTVSGKINFQIT